MIRRGRGFRSLDTDMPHRTLAPVFAGLRVGLHVLFCGLLALVVVRVLVTNGSLVALVLAGVLGLVYLSGLVVARTRRRAWGIVWIVALTLVWAALVWLVPEAAYLVFPLFFLYLHLLPRGVGPIAVVLTTALTIVAFAVHGGLSVGGVVGPIVGAGVALLIGLGYSALEKRAAEREALMAELLATRDRLAAAEREQGTLAERSRLARELHDTVAQGLSSIQMLLHAAERADATGPASPTCASRARPRPTAWPRPVGSSGSWRPRASIAGSRRRSNASPPGGGAERAWRSTSTSMRRCRCRWTRRPLCCASRRGRSRTSDSTRGPTASASCWRPSKRAYG